MRLSDVTDAIEAKLNVTVLSSQYQIIAYLYDVRSASAGDILSNCHPESTAFYKTLKDLEGAGALCSNQGGKDRRTKHYQLADTVRQSIDNHNKNLPRWIQSKLENSDSGTQVNLNQYVDLLQKNLKIRIFSWHYQIIICLYDLKPASAGEIFALCDRSSTTVYTALSQLEKAGLIRSNKNGVDRRRKYYCLAETTRQILDEEHRRMHTWVISKIGEFDGE